MSTVHGALNNSLKLNNQCFKCSLGRSGISYHKKEGDGATPAGTFHFREVFYRSDRIPSSELMTHLPIHEIKLNSGWCDDALSTAYNQYITLPFHRSYEALWRSDHLYDIVVIIGYNDRPTLKNRGSAIFLHIAKPNYQPTAGCIAVSRGDLLNILKSLKSSSVIQINENSITIS